MFYKVTSTLVDKVKVVKWKINKVKYMETLLKTPEQVRFVEMMEDLIENHGYNRGRVAGLCGISAAMVSLICKGTRSPRFSLERLRHEYEKIILADKTPAGGRDAAGPNPLQRRNARNVLGAQLADLQAFDPKGFVLARATINELHRRIGTSGGRINSGPGRSAADKLATHIAADIVSRRGKKRPDPSV